MYKKLLRESAYELTLLCVSDPDTLRYVERRLTRFFKEVVCFEGHEEALEACKQRRFDILFIDLDMEKTRKCFFAESAREQSELQAIVPFSLDYQNCDLLMRLIRLGVDGFVKKPLDDQELYYTLAKICEKILDRQLLMHYLDELEKLQQKMIPLRKQESKPTEIKSKAPVQDDDDFEFFPSSIEQKHSSENQDEDAYKDYFRFLQLDDKEELYDMLDEIDTAILYAFEKRQNVDQHFLKLGGALVKFAGTLMHYQFFGDIGGAILELGRLIEEEADSMARSQDNLQMYISGFCSVLQTFMREVWEQNSGNPKFFNDSVINDAGMLVGMITPQKNDSSDDDIVFF